MESLGLHIDYLLLHHDCVTLPGLGSLLRHRVEAQYDAESETFLPPRQVVSFNPEISRTDGLLARSIARRDSVSDQRAAAILERGIEALRRELSETGSVALGHAGRLHLGRHGGLSFEPAGALCSWLPAVDVRMDAETSVAEEIRQARRDTRGEVFRRVARIAACIAVVFALGWVALQNLRYAPEAQYASITPVGQHAFVESPGEASAPIIWHLRHHDDAVIDVAEETPSLITSAPGYYLVVASLASEKEAIDFVNVHPGHHLGILNTDGRYRVYIAKADKAAPLYSAAASDEVCEAFPASWVCRN